MKKNRTRVISALLAFVLVISLGLLPPQAHAETVISSGYCGSGLSYTLSADGALTISGWGNMDFGGKRPPWDAEIAAITSVVISENVSSIGSHAFEHCINLVSITIPSSVTSIGDGAFWDCASLSSITLPDRLTSIGNATFMSCSSLTSITIPDTITSIGVNAFDSCLKLKTVFYNKGQDAWDLINIESGNVFLRKAYLQSNQAAAPTGSCGENLTYALTDDGVLTISGTGDMDVYNFEEMNIPPWSTLAEQIVSVIISDGVASIGKEAFYGCFNLATVTVADSVSSIGDYAFFDCISLTSITLPDNITSIGDGAFSQCPGLTSIALPDSLTSIGNGAFVGCSGLTSITFPDSLTSICDRAFGFCTSLTSITLPDNITSIGDWAFAYCTSLTSITLPDSVTSIGEAAFFFCFSSTVVVPRGSYAEQYCKDNALNYRYAN